MHSGSTITTSEQINKKWKTVMAILHKTIKEAHQLPEPKIIVYNGASAIIYTGDDMLNEVDQSTISLPRHKALIMLKRSGYLTAVQDEVKKHGDEAVISFDNAPEIHSDNTLVNMVLRGIGLTPIEIYQLFQNAQTLP